MDERQILTAPQILTARARREIPAKRQLDVVIAANGLTRAAVARELELLESTVSSALQGRARSRPTLEALAQWAGIAVEDLERDIAEGRK